MKTFAQHIVEGRDAPLYHAIRKSGDERNKILTSGVLIPFTGQQTAKLLKPNAKNFYWSEWGDQRLSGVSTTRSFAFARRWSTYDDDGGIIIQLDQSKISTRFNIVPVNYWTSARSARLTPRRGESDHPWSEYEEFIITRKPIKLQDYAVRLFIVSRLLIDICISLSKYTGIPYVRPCSDSESIAYISKIAKLPVTVV